MSLSRICSHFPCCLQVNHPRDHFLGSCDGNGSRSSLDQQATFLWLIFIGCKYSKYSTIHTTTLTTVFRSYRLQIDLVTVRLRLERLHCAGLARDSRIYAWIAISR